MTSIWDKFHDNLSKWELSCNWCGRVSKDNDFYNFNDEPVCRECLEETQLEE